MYDSIDSYLFALKYMLKTGIKSHLNLTVDMYSSPITNVCAILGMLLLSHKMIETVVIFDYYGCTGTYVVASKRGRYLYLFKRSIAPRCM